MFALAIWDAKGRRLVLARDRLGEKPLVYRVEPGRLLFASELKSLLQVPGVPRQIDAQALDAYLTFKYVPHPRTIFRGIAKLPPGHLAVYHDDQLEVRRYWNPDFQAEEDRPEEDYAEELRELLTSAVEMRLESDVPLGAFLSGGIDSTIIVGLMQKLCKEPVRTFSVGFPVREYDETRYARQAAERFGTVHHEFQVEPNAVEILPKLVWHYDEPFADNSAVPTWYLAQVTRQHVTVALSGDGGDELFAGYPRYCAAWLAQACDRLPAWLRAGIGARFLATAAGQRASEGNPPATEALRRGGRSAAAAPLPGMGSNVYRGALGDAVQRRISCRPSRRRPFGVPGDRGRAEPRRDPVTSFGLIDLGTYLPGDILVKVDIAAMAHSLETRPPFLDHRVVELAARMPLRHKFRYGRGKRILLRAFADLLPRDIRRRRKMGFGVPMDHWFRGPLAGLTREILLDPRTQRRGLFRPEAVRELVESHLGGRFDHSYRLWSLLFLELWQRQWLD